MGRKSTISLKDTRHVVLARALWYCLTDVGFIIISYYDGNVL